MLNISYLRELFSLSQPAKQPNRPRRAFRPAANEEQTAIGEIIDETFEPSAMDQSAGEPFQKHLKTSSPSASCVFYTHPAH